MKKNTRLLALLLACALLITPFGGLVRAEEPTETPAAAAAEPAATEPFDFTIDYASLDMTYYRQLANTNTTVNVFNWGEYMATNDSDYVDVNKEFAELTGIRVIYDNFSTNEEMYAKLKSGSVSYDVIIPSDYMVSRMIKEEMLLPLDYNQIPNASYIMEEFRNMAFDPNGTYSVPYSRGTTGIIYNTSIIPDAPTSWNALWDANFLGQILMFGSPRDAFGLVLKKLGYSMNSENVNELQQAVRELKIQKPLVQAYVMDEIYDKMIAGEAVMAPYYAGDFFQMQKLNPDLAFSFPDEGVNMFVDSTCIPVVANNKLAAEMYINFLNEPSVAAINMDYIGYSTANTGAFALLGEEVTSDPIRYPSKEILAKAESYVNLSDEANTLMDTLWVEVLTSDETYNSWIMPIFLVACLTAALGINLYRHRKQKQSQQPISKIGY